jgi:signal peptidase II
MARKKRAGKKNKGKNLFFKIAFFVIIIAAIFALDRISKLTTANPSANTGTAFGFFSNSSLTIPVLIIVAFIVLALTAFFYFKIKRFGLLSIGLVLLFAGTLGNLIDRLVFGRVIDFITFSFMPQFPAFNFADVSNVLGVIILIIALLRTPKI